MIKYDKSEIDDIAFELKNDKVLFIPTDTQIGILSKKNMNIYLIKKRSFFKKNVLFIPNTDYVKNINEDFIKLSNKFWPGPLTLIYKKKSYRIPNDETILAILNKTGPLYCSSANISNKKPIEKTSDIKNVFNKKWFKKIIYCDGYQKDNIPSTIYNLDNNEAIRLGRIKKEDIENVIKNK